jgi:hypothetical protein
MDEYTELLWASKRYVDGAPVLEVEFDLSGQPGWSPDAWTIGAVINPPGEAKVAVHLYPARPELLAKLAEVRRLSKEYQDRYEQQ